MITDKLNMINIYQEIPKTVKDFVLGITPDISLGKLILSDDIYANIESYSTKSEFDACFEAHEKYIDIQILVLGTENIYYTDKSGLNIKKTYDEFCDIAFYNGKVGIYPKVMLDGSNFVMLYPHEAHAPQVCASNTSCLVKKVVIKIKV